MVVPSLRDVSSGVYGAWRLARLDSTAMIWFDRSGDGVWRSFWAAAIVYPAFVMLVALQVTPEQWVAAGPARILLVESIGYVVSWTAFPLVILAFCHWLERDEQCLDFIVAYNWSQVLQTALASVAMAAARLLPGAPADAVSLAAPIALLGYEWFIARTALEAGGVAATVVVLIDVVLAEVVSQVCQSLY
jgi:hypothetical protein